MEQREKEYLCIIPARGGSKGLPGKNIKKFCGIPLVAVTILEAEKSKYIKRVIVTSEDEEIIKTALEFDAEVIKRPVELASDSSPTIDSILHVIEYLQTEGYSLENIILLQCTSPLRTVKHIDEAIELFESKKNIADALISATKQEHPPWWNKVLDSEGFLADLIEYDKNKYQRRQDFPDVYSENGAIYIIKTTKLLETLRLDQTKTILYEMNRLDSIDIDNEEDFLFAESIYLKRVKNNG